MNFIRDCVKDGTAIFLLEEFDCIDDLPVNQRREMFLMELLWRGDIMISTEDIFYTSTHRLHIFVCWKKFSKPTHPFQLSPGAQGAN